MPITAIPNDSLLYYDGGQLKKITSDNTVAITQAFTAGSLTTAGAVSGATGVFSSNVSIGGNLVVTGDIVSADQRNVMLGDSFIDLLASNVVNGTVKAGGLTVNIEAQTSPFSATAFNIGVPAGAQPYITVSSDPQSAFGAGDIIQVSGTKNGSNDGLYVVQSTNATQIRIKGTGAVTAPTGQLPFIKDKFVTSTSETTAVVVKAQVSAFASANGTMASAPAVPVTPVGTWCYHVGDTQSSFEDSWTPLTAVVQSLQAAYDGGPTITLTNTNDLVVSKPTSGTAAISLESNLASDFTVVGDTLTLDASRIDLATGNVNFAKAGTIAATTTGTTAGDIVYFDTSFAAQLSDNDGAAAALNVDGVVAASGYVATVQGTRVFVAFTSAPSAGDTAWLSATAGQATATLPASGRIYRLGRVTGVSAGGLYEVVWNPQYIADVPA